MKYKLFCFLFLLILSSCRRSAETESKERTKLFHLFHGKYKILSSTAEQELDLNFDGMASTNLNDELPSLRNCNLEVHLPKSTELNFFIEFWPEQIFGGPTGAAPDSFDPTVTVSYAKQSVSRTCQFAADNKTILLNPDIAGIDLQRYTRPDAINILAGNRIEVIKTKRFYTMAGWKAVRVVTVYERYTMET